MSIKQAQNIFTLGELDERLKARADFEGYFKGAQKLRDMVTIPQGGAIRRFGTSFDYKIVDTGDGDAAVTDPDEVNGHIFNFSATKDFVIIARPNDRNGTPSAAFDIFLDGALQQTKILTNTTTLPYSIAQIAGMSFISRRDRIIILHEDVRPHELVRVTDTNWRYARISLGHFPTYDFSVTDQKYYRSSAFTFTPSATSGGHTITASSNVFNDGHDGGIFIGGGGIARITSVTSQTVVNAETLIGHPYVNTSAIKGINCILTSVAWGDPTGGSTPGSSSDRGWPSRGAFIQNRMVLGRTKALPNMVFFSDSSEFFNFDDSETNDINAFSYDFDSEVLGIVEHKGALIITRTSVEATNVASDRPITPGNIFFQSQSKRGASDVQPRVVDNFVMYADENGQQVNAATYVTDNAAQDSVQVFNNSILSPTLIRNPTTSANYRPADDHGEFLLLTNNDGTMACLQSLKEQNISGWTLARTQGDFKRIMAAGRAAQAIVRRKVNTGVTITGDADKVFTANINFEQITDITASAASAATDATIFAEDGEYLVIGSEMPFDAIRFTLATAASSALTLTYEYLNSTGEWTAFTVTDGTVNMTQTGNITWTLATDTADWWPQEFPAALPDDTIAPPLRKFWLRIQSETAVATAPIEDTIKINVADRLYLENLDFDILMDSNFSTVSDANGLVTGLSHLVGQMVFARVDGVPEGTFFVDASGEITVSGESSDVQVGINYYPELEPMPVIVQDAFAQSVYRPKHINRVYVDYYKSLGIIVNGQDILGLTLGELVLDAKPLPQTGFTSITPMRGWNPRGTNTITQNKPLPMTIIGIGYEMEVS